MRDTDSLHGTLIIIRWRTYCPAAYTCQKYWVGKPIYLGEGKRW